MHFSAWLSPIEPILALHTHSVRSTQILSRYHERARAFCPRSAAQPLGLPRALARMCAGARKTWDSTAGAGGIAETLRLRTATVGVSEPRGIAGGHGSGRW